MCWDEKHPTAGVLGQCGQSRMHQLLSGTETGGLTLLASVRRLEVVGGIGASRTNILMSWRQRRGYGKGPAALSVGKGGRVVLIEVFCCENFAFLPIHELA